ncbi:hypothetical protein [Roseibium album]|uniref:hypothetical protein n=1 Tax=Roseibium album TaxID=311410 RepID=UPI003BB21FA4
MKLGDEIDLVNLPPLYSERDKERREYLLKMVAELQDQYRRAAQPLVDELAEIEAHYPPRAMVVPKTREDS